MANTPRKEKEAHEDLLRDPFVKAFRACKVPMNRTSINKYAVMYLRDKVGIRDFSIYVEDQRAVEKEIMDIEDAYTESGGVPVESEEEPENEPLEE